MTWHAEAYRVVRSALQTVTVRQRGRDMKPALIAMEVVEALSAAHMLRDTRDWQPPKLTRWEHFLCAIGWK